MLDDQCSMKEGLMPSFPVRIDSRPSFSRPTSVSFLPATNGHCPAPSALLSLNPLASQRQGVCSIDRWDWELKIANHCELKIWGVRRMPSFQTIVQPAARHPQSAIFQFSFFNSQSLPALAEANLGQ
ncbi:MAG TPA: hypothetical protein VJS65_05515 [Verrucomicrobiae bacterium]|nr:hypothetical protein [Verrucomicrobiae bacterium]